MIVYKLSPHSEVAFAVSGLQPTHPSQSFLC